MASALKGIDAQIANIEAAVGNKGQPRLNRFSARPKIMGTVMSFGIPEFDAASNIGGHYRGACIELYGVEAGGKSYAAMKAAATYQKNDLKVAWIDPEHSFVPEWAEQAGIDLNSDSFLYGEDFENGEQALMYVLEYCKSGVVGLVVVDSVTALLPKAEVQGSFQDNYMATHARMMSQAVKHIIDAGWKSRTTQIFINQIRTKPGVMFGNPEDTPGGKALKYYAHQRIDVRRKDVIMMGTGEDKKASGIVSKVSFQKNRFGPPFGHAEFTIHFSQETNSPMVQLVQLASKLKILPNRKAIEGGGGKRYVWGKGKDAEVTDATTLTEFADWIDANEHTKELLDLVVAANEASEQKIIIPQEIFDLAKPGGGSPDATTEEAEAKEG